MAIAFDQSLILKVEHAKTDTEVLTAMCNHLCNKGIVKDTYCQAILEREANFPTGLNTHGINVAIPHADVCHVNTASLCVAVLNPAVDFHAMDEPEDAVSVHLVIMLVLTEPHGHLEMLQKIVGLIQNQEDVKKIITAEDKGAIEAVIRRYLLEA